MAIINQPTPSNPKSPEPTQRPLQPGQTPTGVPTDAPPQRPNFQTPEGQRDRARK